MTVPSVAHRLGVDPFGTDDPLIGNVLLYPRRIVLEVLRLALMQEDLFTPTTASGSATERNPFLLRYAADGSISPDSRIVLTDYASDELIRKEGRPRIVVERGGGRFAAKTAFGQRNATAWTGGGANRRSDLYETSVVVRCVGRVKLESESLGLVVQLLLEMFDDEIKKKSDLFQFGPPEAGTTVVEKLDAVGDQFTTTVTVPMVQSIHWLKTKINVKAVEDVCVSVAVIAL